MATSCASSVTTSSTPEPNDHSNKNILKTGKAKRDELNKKQTGSEMDLFSEPESMIKCAAPSTINAQPPENQVITELANENDDRIPSESDKLGIEPQTYQTVEVKTAKPSTEAVQDVSPNDGNDGKHVPSEKEAHATLQFSPDQEIATNLKNLHLQELSSHELVPTLQILNHIDADIEPTEPDLSVTSDSLQMAPIVENGVVEKGPVLKYEYKPGEYCGNFLRLD